MSNIKSKIGEARSRSRPKHFRPAREARAVARLANGGDAIDQAIDRAIATGQPITPDGRPLVAKSHSGEGVVPPRATNEEMQLPGRTAYLEHWAPEYLQEWREECVLRMKMRLVSHDEMAAALQVSLSTIQRTLVRIRKRFATEGKNVNGPEQVGKVRAFNAEITASLMKIAHAKSTPASVKVTALRSIADIQLKELDALSQLGVIKPEDFVTDRYNDEAAQIIRGIFEEDDIAEDDDLLDAD